MALASTLLAAGMVPYNPAKPRAMEAISPAPNSLLVLCLSFMGEGYGPTFDPPTPNVTVSGGGLTWTVREFLNGSGQWDYSGAIYTAQCGASPGTFTPAVDSSGTIGWAGWTIIEVIGHNAAAPYVEGIAYDAAATQTFNLTLPIAPRTTDLVIAMCGADADDAGDPNVDSVAWGSGMTEIYDGVTDGNDAPFGSHSVAIRTGSTSTTVPIADVTEEMVPYSSGGLAIILQAPVLVTDDFNRANASTLGSNWTAVDAGGWAIASNVAAMTTSGGQDSLAVWAADAFPSDQFAEADVAFLDTQDGADVGVCVRYSNSSLNGYSVKWTRVAGGGGEYQMRRTVAGVDTIIGTSVTGVGVTGTRKLRLEAVGTQITAYVNGVQQITATDATFTSGYPGIFGDYTTTSGTFDNFRAGSLPRTDPPTLVAYSQSPFSVEFQGASNPLVCASSFSWVAGDVIVVTGLIEAGSISVNLSISIDNETNLTFTPVSAAAGLTNLDAWGRMWYAVASGSGSGAISGILNAGAASTDISGSIQAWHFRDTDGIGNKVNAAITNTTPTQTMTAQAQSAVVTAWVDYNAVAAGQTGEPNTGILTERLDQQYVANYTGWAADWIGVSAGSDAWGTTSGTGLDLTFAGTIEVLGKTTEGTPAPTTITPVESVSATVSDTAQLTVSTPNTTFAFTEGTYAENNPTLTATAPSGTGGIIVALLHRQNGGTVTWNTPSDWILIDSHLDFSYNAVDRYYSYSANPDRQINYNFTDVGAHLYRVTGASGPPHAVWDDFWILGQSGVQNIPDVVGAPRGVAIATFIADGTNTGQLPDAFSLGWTVDKTGIWSSSTGAPATSLHIDHVANGTFDSGTATFNTSSSCSVGVLVIPTPVNNIATDDFNRANGGLGSNWTAGTGFTMPVIVSNAVSPTTQDVGYVGYWSADTFDNDQWAEADVTLAGDYSEASVVVRQSASGRYMLNWLSDSGGTYQIDYYNGSTFSTISTGNPTGVGTTGTRTLRLEVVGTTLTGYVDGVEEVSVTHSSLTSGSPGIAMYRYTATGQTLDNFRAGDWTTPPLSVTINPVESVSATVSDAGQLTVANPAITDYIIEYRTTSGPGAWQSFTDGVNPSTGATVTGLSPGVSYDFRVAAKNVNGFGTWSNIATATAGSSGVINLKLGDTQILSIKLGDTAITKAYLGDTLVLG